MRAILMVLVAVSAERSVLADERTPDKPVAAVARVDWRVEVQPYVFVPMSTSSMVTDAPIAVETGDVIDKLQFQGQPRVDLWKQRFGAVEVAYRIDWNDTSREPGNDPNDRAPYAGLGFRLGARSNR